MSHFQRFFLISIILLAQPRAVAAPLEDTFSVRTAPKRHLASATIRQVEIRAKPGDEIIKGWFLRLDKMVEDKEPTESEQVILTSNLNDEWERINRWMKTARKVSANYKRLAAEMLSLPIPNSDSRLSQFLKLSAQNYQDTASIYDDFLAPKKYVCLEDLQDTVGGLRRRADAIAQTKERLKSMDENIRNYFEVPMPILGDPLNKYIEGK